MKRPALLAIALALLVQPATGQTRREAPYEGPPSMRDVPHPLRGLPKHGELMSAAVACGLRAPDWERRYFEILEAEVFRLALSPEDAATAMATINAFIAYARRRVRANRREYCSYVANPPDLASGDWIVHGRERPR